MFFMNNSAPDIEFSFPDLSPAFDVVYDYFYWAYTWMNLHGFRLWGLTFSYFDVAIGVAATFLLCTLIPIFGDPEDDDYYYEDFGGF